MPIKSIQYWLVASQCYKKYIKSILIASTNYLLFQNQRKCNFPFLLFLMNENLMTERTNDHRSTFFNKREILFYSKNNKNARKKFFVGFSFFVAIKLWNTEKVSVRACVCVSACESESEREREGDNLFVASELLRTEEFFCQ